MTTETVQAAPGTRRRTLRPALLELAVTTVRWLTGTLDPTAHGWWHTPEGRLLAVAPISGYTARRAATSPPSSSDN
ncbi:hypothetical protein [Streptomyces diastatochromogenes]|uniref:hypothetical protein n=1 Tax=Streptomyces diastatochromogenes TaxID=42236 RepID=UPI0036C60D1D